MSDWSQSEKGSSITRAPPARSNRGAAAASTASGLDFACHAKAVLQLAWRTSLMDKGWGGESVSQSPLVNKAFLGFLDSNPRIPRPSRNEVSLLCPVLHLLRRCVVLAFPKAPGILSCLFAQPRGGIAHVSSTTRDMIIRPPRRRWLPLFWPSRSL
jgi:hypothetical protein